MLSAVHIFVLFTSAVGLVKDDYLEIPNDWYEGLTAERFLTSDVYRGEVNKYGVQCSQSIEEWDASGWINHAYDSRGWFQWYTRFFRGRRCSDDERQISRWAKAAGPNGDLDVWLSSDMWPSELHQS